MVDDLSDSVPSFDDASQPDSFVIAKDAPEERDEVKEIQKMSQGDTNKIRLWRLVVTCVLLLTALAVTLTTYRVLKDEEKNDFETAVGATEEIDKHLYQLTHLPLSTLNCFSLISFLGLWLLFLSAVVVLWLTFNLVCGYSTSMQAMILRYQVLLHSRVLNFKGWEFDNFNLFYRPTSHSRTHSRF